MNPIDQNDCVNQEKLKLIYCVCFLFIWLGETELLEQIQRGALSGGVGENSFPHSPTAGGTIGGINDKSISSKA
jgi:hypothetical protein